jgi:putative transposase
MVAKPADFRWSSHGGNAGYRKGPLLVPHPEYLSLGSDAFERAAAYRAIVAEAVEHGLVTEIRAHLQQQ